MMNKTELISVVAERCDMTKKAASEIVTTVFDTIADTMAEGNDVKITGFGTFRVADVPEREARNPQDGSAIVVPAHRAAKFKAASALKEAVR